MKGCLWKKKAKAKSAEFRSGSFYEFVKNEYAVCR